MLITRKLQSGVTLLETILVLSLISIIMVNGLMIYQGAIEALKVNEARREIIAMETNIRSLYASQQNYEGISSDLIIDSGHVPGGMDTSGGVLKNTFGAEIFVEASGELAANSIGSKPHSKIFDLNAFLIKYDGVTKPICVRLHTMDFGQIGGNYSVKDAIDECATDFNSLNFYFE